MRFPYTPKGPLPTKFFSFAKIMLSSWNLRALWRQKLWSFFRLGAFSFFPRHPQLWRQANRRKESCGHTNNHRKCKRKNGIQLVYYCHNTKRDQRDHGSNRRHRIPLQRLVNADINQLVQRSGSAQKPFVFTNPIINNNRIINGIS